MHTQRSGEELMNYEGLEKATEKAQRSVKFVKVLSSTVWYNVKLKSALLAAKTN